jgi:putative hydroxymethylpyrimidine transport system permease protein
MRSLALAVFLIGLWQVLVLLTGVPAFILPAPMEVFRAAISNAGVLAQATSTTATEIGIGLILGTMLGVIIAIGMTLSRMLRQVLQPLLALSQAIPVFALAPILTLWLGFGLAAKIVVVVLIVFFPIASAFHDGLQAAPSGALDLGLLARASAWRCLIWLRLPHAWPALGASLRIAAIYAPIGAVTGEWVGASDGLGHVMLLANARSKTDLMFAALGVLTAMTIALRRPASLNLTMRFRSGKGKPRQSGRADMPCQKLR